MKSATPILVDATNYEVLIPHICSLMTAPVVGFDIETYDEAHEGIATYRNKKRLVFDTERTIIAGFSVYSEGDENAYYVNLSHADEDKRVPWEEAVKILHAIPDTTLICAHNATTNGSVSLQS